MRKWIAGFQSMTLDKKIKLILTMGITITASVILTISTVSSMSSIMRKSKELVKTNVETTAKSFTPSIGNYYNIAVSLIPDENIQLYLKKDAQDQKYAAARENNLNSLSHVLFQQPDINFIALYKTEKEYIYRGQAITKTRFLQEYALDLEKSIRWGQGELQISYADAYFEQGIYTFSFYQPIYDMNKIGRTIGNVCINASEEAFDFMQHQKLGDWDLDMYLIDQNGKVLFCEDKELLGTVLELNEIISGGRGDFSKSGKMYVYQKIENSDLYIMGTIDNFAMVNESFITMSFLIATVLIIVAVTLFMVSKVVKRYYEPMEKLVTKMEQVSRGNLDIRINEKHSGQDFITLGRGFNHMMEEINQLMEQVKLEQHQIAQIQFNALQSQIKPHFLYNALDCIHWQAVSEGNKEISVFVKALANYYRACLSKGRDIISLCEELEHVRSYLVIQNIRYENILESRFDIDQQYYEIEIPKMTLQPLIENVIYHGMKTKGQKKGIVVLSVAEDGEDVILRVADNGQGMSSAGVVEMNRSISEYDESFGYGVRNVHKRIQLQFGEAYGLYYETNQMGGVTVNIRLPKS